MIVAVGIDTAEIARFERLEARAGGRFLARIYTQAERDYCLERARPAESLAARFAAKEAVLKCLGTGWSASIGFREVEVIRDSHGAVSVRLSGAAADRARRLGIDRIHLSLSHSAVLATAFAVAETSSQPAE